MLEERPPQGAEPVYRQDPSTSTLKITMVAALLVAGFALGYAILQHSAVQQLSSDRAELRTSLDSAKAQVDSLSARVNALTAAQAH